MSTSSACHPRHGPRVRMLRNRSLTKCLRAYRDCKKAWVRLLSGAFVINLPRVSELTCPQTEAQREMKRNSPGGGWFS